MQELAAFAARGLLQSLVVRQHRKGKFAVVAGGRRLAALQLLAEQGRIEATSLCRARCVTAATLPNSASPKTCCAS